MQPHHTATYDKRCTEIAAVVHGFADRHCRAPAYRRSPLVGASPIVAGRILDTYSVASHNRGLCTRIGAGTTRIVGYFLNDLSFGEV